MVVIILIQCGKRVTGQPLSRPPYSSISGGNEVKATLGTVAQRLREVMLRSPASTGVALNLWAGKQGSGSPHDGPTPGETGTLAEILAADVDSQLPGILVADAPGLGLLGPKNALLPPLARPRRRARASSGIVAPACSASHPKRRVSVREAIRSR